MTKTKVNKATEKKGAFSGESVKKLNHPTKRLLIKVTSDLLEKNPLPKITSDLVLNESGISKGSLYHFFTDFDELLEITQIERLSFWVNSLIEFMSDEFEKVNDLDSFKETLQIVMSSTNTIKGTINNSELTRTLGFALGNPRFTKGIVESKQKLHDALTTILESAIAKCRSISVKIDAENLAFCIQTWIFGQITGDFYKKPMVSDQWEALTKNLVNCLLAE